MLLLPEQEELRVKAANGGEAEVAEMLAERSKRLEMLEERRAVTARLVEVVGRLDEKLESHRRRVLPAASPCSAAFLEECRQGGPATEREVGQVMTSCLQEAGPALRQVRYLTGVDIKSLNGPELREQSRVVSMRPQYHNIEFPKGEWERWAQDQARPIEEPPSTDMRFCVLVRRFRALVCACGRGGSHSRDRRPVRGAQGRGRRPRGPSRCVPYSRATLNGLRGSDC